MYLLCELYLTRPLDFTALGDGGYKIYTGTNWRLDYQLLYCYCKLNNYTGILNLYIGTFFYLGFR
jgi:hypothetical protein